jgi:nucleoside 2-deoxyribosyltransferase
MLGSENKCPIWGVAAKIELLVNLDRLVESPRAGGKYLITKLAIVNLEEQLGGITEIGKFIFRAKLSTWIVDQIRIGSLPLLDEDVLARVKRSGRLSIGKRTERLLSFLSVCAPILGKSVVFAATARVPTVQGTNEATRVQEACAASECLESHVGQHWLSGELGFLLSGLKEQGSLDIGDGFVRITAAGHARLAELEQTAVDSSQAFVAMWFADSMTPIYDKGIDPAIRAAGYEPFRVDRKEHNDKIDDEIIAEIRRSRFLIADFTSEPEKPRGGVYFEAGFAKGLNIPVIWMCRKDMIDKIHFDTRQYAHIVWENETDLAKQLKNRILATIGQVTK